MSYFCLIRQSTIYTLPNTFQNEIHYQHPQATKQRCTRLLLLYDNVISPVVFGRIGIIID